MNRRLWQIVIVAVGAVAMVAVSVQALDRACGSGAEIKESGGAQPDGDSLVYRFDTDEEGFVFTFTLPLPGASPRGVRTVARGDAVDVWFTEWGADRIGRLTFTSTTEYAYQGYPLRSGSRPLNLIASQGFIWFTAAKGDYVGRLDPSTGDVEAFDVGEGSYPADLTLGADGHVWFTQRLADQLAELIVTSTVDYAVNVYTDTFLSEGRPYGIAAGGSTIYLAQTANDLVSVFTPPSSWVHLPGPGFITLDGPYDLAVDNRGSVWGTERGGDAVIRLGFGTLPLIDRYRLSPAAGQPEAIAVDPEDNIWFTQRAAGQIGRLNPRLPSGERTWYYPLPLAGASPRGIAADGAGGIWTVASRPHRIYLPLVLRRVAE